MWDVIVQVIGSSALSVFFIYVLNTIFPKWLDYRWARALEQAKSELESAADRIFKVHAKEFDVLSDLWAKANYAYGALQIAVRPGYRDDISNHNEDELRQAMEFRKFSKLAVKNVMNAPNKSKRYTLEFKIIDFERAEQKINDFSNEFFVQELFIPIEVVEKLDAMRVEMRSVLNKAKTLEQLQVKNPQLSNEISSELKALFAQFESIKSIIRKHLRIDSD